MNSYIDTKSYEDHVSEAKPTGGYEQIVQRILANERSDWSHSIYNSEYSYYPITKAKIEQAIYKNNSIVRSLKEKIDTTRKKIDDTKERVEELIKQQSENSSEMKKLQAIFVKIPELEEQINEWIQEILYAEDQLQVEKEKLHDYNYAEYVGSFEYNGIKRAQYEYKKTHDVEYLRKAVHYICEHADKLRYGSKYIAPYYGHLLDKSNSPFSPEETERRNRIILNINESTSAW
jgi:hypothetical protein